MPLRANGSVSMGSVQKRRDLRTLVHEIHRANAIGAIESRLGAVWCGLVEWHARVWHIVCFVDSCEDGNPVHLGVHQSQEAVQEHGDENITSSLLQQKEAKDDVETKS